jgi:hypothetical protein
LIQMPTVAVSACGLASVATRIPLDSVDTCRSRRPSAAVARLPASCSQACAHLRLRNCGQQGRVIYRRGVRVGEAEERARGWHCHIVGCCGKRTGSQAGHLALVPGQGREGPHFAPRSARQAAAKNRT